MNTVTEPLAPTFKPFDWVAPEDQADTRRYVMMSTIRDLASGVAVALQIIEKSALNVDVGDEPIINGRDVSRLTRMSIAAMDVIEGYIDEHFDEMSDSGAARRRTAKGNAS